MTLDVTKMMRRAGAWAAAMTVALGLAAGEARAQSMQELEEVGAWKVAVMSDPQLVLCSARRTYGGEVIYVDRLKRAGESSFSGMLVTIYGDRIPNMPNRTPTTVDVQIDGGGGRQSFSVDGTTVFLPDSRTNGLRFYATPQVLNAFRSGSQMQIGALGYTSQPLAIDGSAGILGALSRCVQQF